MKPTKDHETQPSQNEKRQKVLEKFQCDATDILIMDAMFDFPGVTQEEIGALVNLGREAVNARVNSERFKRALSDRMEAPKKKLEKAAPRVLARYLKLCEYAEEGVSERACSKVLNSLGIIQNQSEVKLDQRVVLEHIIKRPGDRGETVLAAQILPPNEEEE